MPFGLIAKFEIHEFRVLSLMAGERQVAAEFEIQLVGAPSLVVGGAGTDILL